MSVLFIKKSLDRSEFDLVSKVHEKGLKIDVLTSKDSPYRKELEQKGIYICSKEYNSKINIPFIFQIRELIRERKYRVIHATDGKGIANAVWASYFTDTRILGYRGTLAKIRRTDPSYWLSILSPRVERIICVNRSIYEYMKNFLSEDKLVLNYKGYDPAWSDFDLDALEKPDLPKDAFVVVYIADTRGRPHKGLELLVKGMHLIERNDIHLVFIGSYGEEAERLAATGPASGRIHFLGRKPGAAAYLKMADLFVLPSLRDGLPRSIKEAMAVAVPVVVTDIPGPSELVEPGVSGVLIEPGQPQELAKAIEYLYDNPDMRREMGLHGQEILKSRFSSEVFVEKTLAVYREMGV